MRERERCLKLVWGDIHIYSLRCIDQNVLYDDFCLFLFLFFQMKFTLKQIMRVILEFSVVEVLLLLVLLLHRTHLRSILIIDLCFLLLLLMLCSVEYIVYLKVRDTGAQCVLCFALHLSL